ncbi:MAG: GGDEF domain-containing protein [Planctomycetes bacterium]|nr:GGDEF domain-containing protein [Planctomycetota bacterium]
MTDILTTRFSNSIGAVLAQSAARCMLVRIYPVKEIEPPLVLGSEQVLVGRDSSCSLPLYDDSVSRRHAMIESVGQSHLVTDLGSTNGTFVNEQCLHEPRLLRAGDRVRFGNQIFKYLSADRIEAQYHEVVFHLMTTDGLTTVHNKRYFLETLEREFEQSTRAGSPLCVVMMDLDKFKFINDTHGHLAGDAVLVEFAQRAKSVLRSGDLLARYGGEEFALLMTRTSLADAIQVAERIRQVAAATPIDFEEHAISVTVSLGLSCLTPHRACKPADMLARADEQLYLAKRSGRNQVCHSSGTNQPSEPVVGSAAGCESPRDDIQSTTK